MLAFSNGLTDRDQVLQQKLGNLLIDEKLQSLVKARKLGVAYIDIGDISRPLVAGVNEYEMFYAASLPKLAILLGLFRKIEAKQLVWSSQIKELADEMISLSSNPAATQLFYLVGPNYIANVLLSPELRLYEPLLGGGLWVGKEYGPKPAWQREPLKHLSHAANALQVARFYYLLESGGLLHNAVLSHEMKSILGRTYLSNKFVKGLSENCGKYRIYRKSGAWKQFFSDSVLLHSSSRNYIAVALVEDLNGDQLLEKLIVGLDRLSFPA
ncbi:MAG: serine hydrolase [Bdellovibrionales bacterium]|nr:serine hydrolase [Bdellovibrionales bacterium]